MSPRRWIGLDSSIAAFGWAVLEASPYVTPTLVGLGVWRTVSDSGAQRKTDDLDRRLDELGTELLGLLDRTAPGELYLEGLARGQNDGWLSVSALGQIRGLVLGIAKARGLKVVSFRPSDAKRWVTGRKGEISKLDVAQALERTFPELRTRVGGRFTELALNATDALAIAVLGDTRGRASSRISPNVIRSPSSEPLDDIEL